MPISGSDDLLALIHLLSDPAAVEERLKLLNAAQEGSQANRLAAEDAQREASAQRADASKLRDEAQALNLDAAEQRASAQVLKDKTDLVLAEIAQREELVATQEAALGEKAAAASLLGRQLDERETLLLKREAECAAAQVKLQSKLDKLKEAGVS